VLRQTPADPATSDTQRRTSTHRTAYPKTWHSALSFARLCIPPIALKRCHSVGEGGCFGHA
jgi:hypothetical protein